MGYFKLQRSSANNQFYFNLFADNHERILTSEMYTTKDVALNGIASVKKNSGEDSQYNRLEAKNGQFYFTLKAKNHEVIGKSEMYTSESGRDNGIASCMKNGPTADTRDETGG